YYNPADPNDCVLEKDDGGNIGHAWRGIAALFAWILAGFVIITLGADWLETVTPHPARVPVVTGLIIFSLVMILFGRMLARQTHAMRKWPTAAGRIVRSDVTTTVQQHNRPNMVRDYRVTMYVPRIVYAYEVGGNPLEGDDIGWTASANKPSVAQ